MFYFNKIKLGRAASFFWWTSDFYFNKIKLGSWLIFLLRGHFYFNKIKLGSWLIFFRGLK